MRHRIHNRAGSSSQRRRGRIIAKRIAENLDLQHRTYSHVRTVLDKECETAAQVFALAGSLSPCPRGKLIATHAPQVFLDGMAGVELGDNAPNLAQAATQASQHARNASVVALVGGAPTTFATYRGAADRFSPSIRAFALRAETGGTAAMQRNDRFTALTIPELESLAAALWSVSQR